ncbi:hypothetical protein OA007_02275 [SAR116 cluster bacterium]|nr:hypothetical protein [SAR116 cluster bacterium]
MFAETLAGIALVKSAVDGIKGAISTAKDISEIADDIDKLFTGEQQIQRKRIKKQNDPFSVGSVARETIDAKLAQEQMYEVSQLVDLRFGHGTWQGIINERARRLQEQKEAERQHRLAQDKHKEELMIAAAVGLGLIAALGVFAFLYLKFV